MNLLHATLLHHREILEIYAFAIEHQGSFTSLQFDEQFTADFEWKDTPLSRLLGVRVPVFGPGISGDALFLSSETPYLELLLAMTHCGLLHAVPDAQNSDLVTYHLRTPAAS